MQKLVYIIPAFQRTAYEFTSHPEAMIRHTESHTVASDAIFTVMFTQRSTPQKV
jgi:hypothetical protein